MALATTQVRRRPSSSSPSTRTLPLSPPQRYYVMWGLVVLLTLFGLAMVMSTTSLVDAATKPQSAWTRFVNQGTLAVVGLVVTFVVSRINVHVVRPLITFGLVGTLVMCFMALGGPFAKQVNGANAWVDFGGPLQLQPSELVKMMLLLQIASVLARRERQLADLRSALLPCVIWLGGAVLIVLVQKDLGTAIVMVAMSLIVLFVAGAPLTPLLGVALASVGGGVIAVWSEGYRRRRFFAFLSPDENLDGIGHQLNQARISIASGGIFGNGYGQGRGKWGWLREAHNDFIFAVIAEELGLIGGLMVVAAIGALVGLGWRTARRAPDRFSMLVAAGVTAWIAVQSSLNLGAALGLMPITGLPLPFISYGGSSLLTLLAASGLLLSIARRSSA
jgi:cell division protein FtsW